MLYVVVGLFLAILVAVAVFSTTAYFQVDGEVPTVVTLLSEGSVLPLAGLACGVAVLLLMVIAAQFSRRVPKKVAVAIVLAVTTALGLWWVLIQDIDTSRFGDSFRLLSYAKDAAGGDWGSFTGSAAVTAVSQLPDDAHLYFMEYPFQAGIFWYFYAFYRLFGEYAVKALLVVNVLADEVVVAVILGIADLFDPEDRCPFVVCVVATALCLPLHFSAAFPYGNNVGFCFGSLFIYLQCRAICANSMKPRLLFIGASFVPLVLTLAVKSTFILFAIASVICWLIHSVKARSPWMVLAAVAVLLVSNSLSSAPVHALESKAGYSFGDGMPKTSWLMLGSNRSDSTGAAGWWDTQAIEVFLSAEGDKDAQGALAMDAIKSNVSEFLDSPVGALSFYFEKLSTEWADPTFEFFVYAGMNAKDFDTFFDPYSALGTNPPAALFAAVLDGVQISVYVLALSYVASCVMKRDFFGPQLLLVGIFFTGFGCYLLWEAKGIYLLPFYVLLIPLASQGACFMSELFEKRLGNERS